MKKLITIFIFIILFLFIGICLIVGIDKGYIDDMKSNILKNTDIKDIIYVNDYNNYYLVKDKEYLYLFNSNYEEIYKVKINLLYDNKKDYEIVYRDNTIMYMDSYKDKEGIIFKYYDIYTYEVIDEVIIGGN